MTGCLVRNTMCIGELINDKNSTYRPQHRGPLHRISNVHESNLHLTKCNKLCIIVIIFYCSLYTKC